MTEDSVPKPKSSSSPKSALFIIGLIVAGLLLYAGIASNTEGDPSRAYSPIWTGWGATILIVLVLAILNERAQKPWLPGFRSRKSWKQIVAVVLYILLGVIIVSFANPSNAAPRAASSRPALPTPSKSAAQAVDPRQLAAAPLAYKGENIVLVGETQNVTQNTSYTWISFGATIPGRSATESVVVEVRPNDMSVLKDECYRVYGIGGGTSAVKVILTGASGERPLVNAYALEKLPTDKYGNCEK